MMLALVAGCRASDDTAQADNGVAFTTVAQIADNATPPPPEPVVAPMPPPATPARVSPTVTVRAQPAPYFPLDLPPSDVAASAAPFPREVTEFMVARDSCDHFRGEEPYDAERRAYIAENIAELCRGTDTKLALLRQRYASDPSVIAALRGYEDQIEKHMPKQAGLF
ncbi:hypothetical protein [Sphingobium xenophagum]|nr:hypothetical protein [Sphingobium xenophagum]